MADVKWIKIVTDIFDDEKMLLIESLPEADSIIVIWFKLLTLAGKQNNSGVFMLNDRIPYTDEMFATIFRRKKATVQMALKVFHNFGMIEIINNAITIPNWSKHQNLDQIQNRTDFMRDYMRKYREKQKAIAENKEIKGCKPNSKPNSKPNVNPLDIDKDIDKELEREREKEKKEGETSPPIQKNVLEKIEAIVGNFLNPNEIQLLMEHQKDTGQDWELILKAYEFVEEKRKSKNAKYVTAILNNWYKDYGIRTVEELEKVKKDKEAEKLKGTGYNKSAPYLKNITKEDIEKYQGKKSVMDTLDDLYTG